MTLRHTTSHAKFPSKVNSIVFLLVCSALLFGFDQAMRSLAHKEQMMMMMQENSTRNSTNFNEVRN